MEENYFIKILKWIGILPIAIISYILGYLLFYFLGIISFKWGLFFLPNSILDAINTIWTYIATAGISAGVAVYLGSVVAPSGKRIVSVVLATILCSLLIISVMIYIQKYETISMALGIAGCIASFIGAIIGSVCIFSNYDSKDNER